MITQGVWGRRLLSLGALTATVVVAMMLLSPSRPAPVATPSPSETRLSPAEEYAHAALTIMGEHAFFVDEATWWPGVAREAMAAVHAARSPAETYEALDTALAAAAGPQGLLLSPKDVPTPEAPDPPAVSAAGGVGWISVPTVGPVSGKDASDRATALADTLRNYSAAATCGWVIDLRYTGSQEDWGLFAGLSGFLKEGPVFDLKDRYGRAFHVSAAMGSVFLDGRPMASASHPAARDARPVAVLQSGDTSGTGEALVVALRESKNVRTFGAATRGWPFTEQFTLSDGAQLVLPTTRLTDRAGNDYSRGVPPTVAVGAHVGTGQFDSTDQTKWVGEQWLRSLCKQG